MCRRNGVKECGFRMASARNAASAVNVASGNVALECGVREECGVRGECGVRMWRQNVASGKKMWRRNVASERNVVSEGNRACRARMWRQRGMWRRGECGVRECGITVVGNVASECSVSVRAKSATPFATTLQIKVEFVITFPLCVKSFNAHQCPCFCVLVSCVIYRVNVGLASLVYRGARLTDLFCESPGKGKGCCKAS